MTTTITPEATMTSTATLIAQAAKLEESANNLVMARKDAEPHYSHTLADFPVSL